VVDVAAAEALPTPVSLKAIKATPSLARMSLVTSMRLSVQPVTDDEWNIVRRMGGLPD
jgi:predicted RNA-binding protein with PUA-like domain